MKRIISVILAIACLFTISGCKKKEEDKKSSSSKTSSISSISSSSAVSLPPETGFALEIRPTIKKAIELYDIFFVGSLEFDRTQSVDYKGDTYFLVTSTQYKNVAELTNALNSVITKDKTELFLAFPKYIDSNGKLYCLDTSAETKYNWKDFNTTVVDKTDATATLKVSVLLVDNSSRVEVTITLIKENNIWLINDYDRLS